MHAPSSPYDDDLSECSHPIRTLRYFGLAHDCSDILQHLHKPLSSWLLQHKRYRRKPKAQSSLATDEGISLTFEGVTKPDFRQKQSRFQIKTKIRQRTQGGDPALSRVGASTKLAYRDWAGYQQLP